NREVWEKRIERWRESGLTAKEFAGEAGVNAGTLTHWKYRLAAERRRIGSALAPLSRERFPVPKWRSPEPNDKGERMDIQTDAPTSELCVESQILWWSRRPNWRLVERRADAAPPTVTIDFSMGSLDRLAFPCV